MNELPINEIDGKQYNLSLNLNQSENVLNEDTGYWQTIYDEYWGKGGDEL